MKMDLEEFLIGTRSKTSLKKAGFNTEEDFRDKTEDDLKAAGLGKTGIFELKEYLKFHHKIKIVKVKKKKIDNIKECQQLVDYFLEGVPSIDWPRELKKADTLLKVYKLDFLLKIPVPRNIYSLGYFFQDFGQEFIRKNAPVVILAEPEEKSQEVVGNIPEIEYNPSKKKIKTLKEFLNIKK
jgi:hypothetical protein